MEISRDEKPSCGPVALPILTPADLPQRPATTEPVVRDPVTMDEQPRTTLIATEASTPEPPPIEVAAFGPVSSSTEADNHSESGLAQPELAIAQLERQTAQSKLEAAQIIQQVDQGSLQACGIMPDAAELSSETAQSKATPADAQIVLTQNDVKASKMIPPEFLDLLQILQDCLNKQNPRPYRSQVADKLIARSRGVYKKAGVSTWSEFAAKAQNAGFVKLGGQSRDPWITLHPNWHGKVSCTTAVDKSTSASGQSAPAECHSKAPGMQCIQSNSQDTSCTQPGKAEPKTMPAIPAEFLALLQILQRSINGGNPRPLRSTVALDLSSRCRDAYERSDVSGWKRYAAKAEKAGFVELGGWNGDYQGALRGWPLPLKLHRVASVA